MTEFMIYNTNNTQILLFKMSMFIFYIFEKNISKNKLNTNTSRNNEL